MANYVVHVKAKETTYYDATLEVEASTEEEALKQSEQMFLFDPSVYEVNREGKYICVEIME